MQQLIILLVTLLPLTTPQPTEEMDIKKTIDTLFDGMRSGDGQKVASCFIPEATMYTTASKKDGSSFLQKGSLSEFVAAVSSPHKEVWNEKILSYDIKVDENLASAWCPYQFYLDEQLLHCGVNAFQLIKQDTGWKILHITDTRRKNDCE